MQWAPHISSPLRPSQASSRRMALASEWTGAQLGNVLRSGSGVPQTHWHKRLTEYLVFCAQQEVSLGDNRERTHESLIYSRPDQVYRTARGGRANIVDKFSERDKPRSGTEQD